MKIIKGNVCELNFSRLFLLNSKLKFSSRDIEREFNSMKKNVRN